MMYTCYPNTSSSSIFIQLWSSFIQEQLTTNPTLILNPCFDIEKYINHQFSKPLTFGWLLNDTSSTQAHTAIGCILVSCYDEALPPGSPPELQEHHNLISPFAPRRIGTVLGLYIHPEHRNLEAINTLLEPALQKAEEMKVTDIHVRTSIQLTGLQALLQRKGFNKNMIEMTQHIDRSNETNLPSLHPTRPQAKKPPKRSYIRSILPTEI